jgi:Tol biopolymer transport system component/DNA-binding winged helix-turn-helix (wHTH) protein
LVGVTLKTRRLYRFGPFCVDAAAKVLLKDGQTLHLTRKAVETLLILVENAGQVVTREEMMEALWPDRVVEEANLAQNIAVVRRALAAKAGSPEYIETFAGRGYRLVGPITALDQAPSQVTPSLWWQLRRHIPAWPIWGSLLLIVVAVILPNFRRPLRPPGELRVVPFTRLPGKEFQPAVTAEGRNVAFLWEREGGQPPAVWTQAVGETAPTRTTTGEGHYSSPAWAPNGRDLAYLRIGGSSTELLIHSAHSGEERIVTRLVPPNYGFQYRLLDWSPDGQWFVVSHSDSPKKPLGLFLVASATGEKKRLTDPGAVVGGDVDPRFSRDGKTISFIRYIHRSQQELYSVPATGGTARQLTADGKQVSDHDWTPDGRAILLASDRGGAFRLWRIAADAPAPAKNLEPVAIYGEFPIELALARQAPTLVYSVLQQDRNIWRLDLKEKTWSRIIASSAQDASPQYSPSGESICFRSDRSGEEELWVSDAAGENAVQVTRGPLYPSVGHWSPDGRSIIFNNARTGAMFVAGRDDGGRWSVRSAGVFGVHPVFSPDGRWIYAGTTTRILRAPAAGGAASAVLNTGGFSLGVSNDGQYLYFMRDANDTVLWRASTDTWEMSKALDGLLPNCTSCWALAPGGIHYLAADRQSFDVQRIYFHDFATGQDREIVKYPEPLSPVGSGPFSLSPDLRYLLCVRVGPSNSDLMRVEPFR